MTFDKYLSESEFNKSTKITVSINVKKNMLLLFPSWLSHGVKPNEQQTKDVISISFNTFVRGTLGQRENLNRLIL